MKVLILDIETSPSLAFVWNLWNENVNLDRLVETGQVISFAAKWYGEKKVLFHSDFHDGHDAMILAAWQLLDEADVIVHYNGRAFDIKWLNREFLLAGLPPPTSHKDVDLYSVVRSRFKFTSNKLQHVATELGLGSKQDTGGFQTWVKCMQMDATAWRNMKKYNIGDVELTESLYEKLLPWIRNHPSRILYDGIQTPACPVCGGTHLQKRGYYHTQVSKFQRLHCMDCNSYSRQNARVDNVALQPAS